MNLKKLFSILSLIVLVTLTSSQVFAANKADIMYFNFTIEQGNYVADKNGNNGWGAISYKYYPGTKTKDKSAYVINDATKAINYYHYLTTKDTNQKRSNTSLHIGGTRNSYPNWASKDTAYGCYFVASRQNWWDGYWTIYGSWSADDQYGK